MVPDSADYERANCDEWEKLRWEKKFLHRIFEQESKLPVSGLEAHEPSKNFFYLN